MNDITIVSSSFKQQLSSSYILSIQIRLDGLSFAVFDPIKNEFVAYGSRNLEENDENFARQEELMLTTDLLKSHYGQTIVSVAESDFTLVPNALHSEAQNATFLHFVGAKTEPDSQYLSDEIAMASTTLVYAMPRFLYYFLKIQFANLKIIHSATATANSLMMKRLSIGSRAVVAVDLCRESIKIVCTDNNLLRICVQHHCDQIADAIYIVMNTIEQLKLNPTNLQITVGGEMAEEFIQQLGRYINRVELQKLPNYFGFAMTIDEPHKYVNLFNTMLCV